MGNGGLQKWVTGVVLATLVSGFAFFALRDRAAIDAQFVKDSRDIEALRILVMHHDSEIILLRAWQDRETADMAELRSLTVDNSRKLDRLILMHRKEIVQ